MFLYHHIHYRIHAILPKFCTLQNSQEGAQTSIFCAVEEGLEEHSGKYFADCAIAKQSDASKDDGLAKKLWEASEILTGLS